MLDLPLSQLAPETFIFFEHEGKTLYPVFQVTPTGKIFTFIADAIAISKGILEHKVLYVYMCDDFDEINGNIAHQLQNTEADSRLYEKLIVLVDNLASRNRL